MGDTFFASADRTDESVLAHEIDTIARNPVVTGILQSVNGLLAILDANRQIVAINDSFLHMLGIDNPEETLGLRAGEVLDCIHAKSSPSGCGTTKFCSTCGAAIAQVACLENNQTTERTCALATRRDGKDEDLTLLVKAHPITIENKTFILLFLQDVSQQQQRAALERTFFHDINNMLSMLVGASELLIMETPSVLSGTIHQASMRLMKEVSIQRHLMQSDDQTYKPYCVKTTIGQILNELQTLFANHPAAHDKTLNMISKNPTQSINIDMSLLLRILSNMVINALEATEKNGEIKMWTEHGDNHMGFLVWNDQNIPEDIALRVFQRNFSTKSQEGRGIGTFSMKLFGEKFLGGKVSFTSSEAAGTIFRFQYPLEDL
jgi:K+-sensing histidine kinase KdpD